MMTIHLLSQKNHTRLKFDLEKLKDPSVLETFQAMTGRKFTPLTIMNKEDADMNLMCYHHLASTQQWRKQSARSLANTVGRRNPKSLLIFLFCVTKGECWERKHSNLTDLSSQKYREANNNTKKHTKKNKENLVGKQWDRRNSAEVQQQESIPSRERLDHCETGNSYYCPRPFRKKPYRRTRDDEPMDRQLLWSVQSQGQWRSISTEVFPNKQRGRPPYLSQRYFNQLVGALSPVNHRGLHQGWSFTKKRRLLYNHWRKESQPQLTTSQQNWSRQVEKK